MDNSPNDTPRTVVIPPEARTAQVELHMRSTDAYLAARDRNDAAEKSGRMDEGWHRWARFEVDGVMFVVHDPQCHVVDPLGDDRIVELQQMLAVVLVADDMTGAEKALEVARLTERIQGLLLGAATYPDGGRDATTRGLDVVADLAAMPGSHE